MPPPLRGLDAAFVRKGGQIRPGYAFTWSAGRRFSQLFLKMKKEGDSFLAASVVAGLFYIIRKKLQDV